MAKFTGSGMALEFAKWLGLETHGLRDLTLHMPYEGAFQVTATYIPDLGSSKPPVQRKFILVNAETGEPINPGREARQRYVEDSGL